MTQPRHAVGDPSDASTPARVLEIDEENDRGVDRARDLPSDLDDDRGDDLDHAAHDLADHDRDLVSSDPQDDPTHDPELDPDADEVWFEADALAAASHVELGTARGSASASARPLAPLPALEQLRAAMASPGLSLAQLPGWPDAGPHGQGLGPALAELLGELRPGNVVLFGGRGRALGRSSLLAQLGDGLALREHADLLTPVVGVVDGPPTIWRARSLARFAGLDARVFLDPGWTRREPTATTWLDRYAASSWAQLDQRQRFVDAAIWRDADARLDLLDAIGRWRGELAEHAAVVWPILIVDPLEQLEGGLGQGLGPRPGQERAGPRDPSWATALASLARLAETHQLIVLASHDAHDDTRTLDRHAHARLELGTVGDDRLELVLEHRRLGPRGRVGLRWDRASGRIAP